MKTSGMVIFRVVIIVKRIKYNLKNILLEQLPPIVAPGMGPGEPTWMQDAMGSIEKIQSFNELQPEQFQDMLVQHDIDPEEFDLYFESEHIFDHPNWDKFANNAVDLVDSWDISQARKRYNET